MESKNSSISNPKLRSYSDFRKVIKGKTSANMKDSYDRLYFENMVGSKELANEYFASKGLHSTVYTQKPIELANIKLGDRVIDVGCGRGEIVFQTAKAGAISTGIDFSESAIEIALGTSKYHDKEMQSRTRFICGDATNIGLEGESFDKAFLLDVVEHVSKKELLRILKEIRRVLVPQGMLIIHSSPNRWASRYGFRLVAAAYKVLNKGPYVHPVVTAYQACESDPELDESKVFLHINEQSILSLKISLILSGFKSRVWLGNTGNRWDTRKDPKGRLLSAMYKLLGFKYLLGSQIYSVACPVKSL